jgi:cell division protein FtsB
MSKHEWIDWDGAAGAPALRAGDSVRVQIMSGRTLPEALHPDEVDWPMVRRYLVVPEPVEERLERENVELRERVGSLTSHVANLERLCSAAGRELNAKNAECDKLRAERDRLCADIHAITSNFAEFVAATHEGVKRGIEAGDLPPDYYGRFRTTWAPKK